MKLCFLDSEINYYLCSQNSDSMQITFFLGRYMGLTWFEVPLMLVCLSNSMKSAEVKFLWLFSGLET